MADDFLGADASRFKVREWFLVFRQSTTDEMALVLTQGRRFKHVACFGFIPAIGCWLFHDWDTAGTRLIVVPDEDADPFLARMQDDAVVVRFVTPTWRVEDSLKPGFWCVTSVAHLTGVKSCALQPDDLFRDCLADGGEIVVGEMADVGAEAEGRPGTGAPATCGAAG